MVSYLVRLNYLWGFLDGFRVATRLITSHDKINNSKITTKLLKLQVTFILRNASLTHLGPVTTNTNNSHSPVIPQGLETGLSSQFLQGTLLSLYRLKN